MGKHLNQPPMSPDDGKRGYRKPPKEHQFPKGTSGNPRGRPVGTRGVKTDLKAVLGVIRTVNRNGKEVTGTTQRLILEALALRGVLGDVKAAATLLPIILQVLGIEDRDTDKNRLPPNDQLLLERLLARRLAEEDRVSQGKVGRNKGGKGRPGKKDSGGGKTAGPGNPKRKSRRSGRTGPEDGVDA